MVGNQDRWREDIFVACPLRDLVPDDHILKRVDRVLDLSWLRDDVADCYCSDNGRPSIDPEAALRLMLAGFFAGIVHDRKLMREAQVNLAIRWFAGYRLHEELPDHSSLTRIRQRWGEERFKRIFQRTVTACGKAGLVDGETVHVDATLIRADVSWESVVEGHAEQVLAENTGEDDDSGQPATVSASKRGRPRSRSRQPKKHSLTDPEATIATSSHQRRMEPCFKQHTGVDDKADVIVDVAVTTGEDNEGTQLLDQVNRIEGNTGREPKTVTADAGYAHSHNYAELEKRKIEAVIPPQHEPGVARKLPVRRFRYDARHQVVRCPCGKQLHHGKESSRGLVYYARKSDCRRCPLRCRCLSPGTVRRTILIVPDYEALLRARRRRAKGWDAATKAMYHRHQWRVEGKHGEAKVMHGLRRAVRRGRWNEAIQAYLTAAVMNLKCLAALLLVFLWWLYRMRTAASQLRSASVTN